MLNRLPQFKLPRRRALLRAVNMLTILLATALVIWKGPTYFAESSDPALYRLLLYIITTASAIGFLFQTYRSGANTLFTALIKGLALVVLILIGTWVTGATLTIIEPVKTGECPRLFALADSLQKEGNLEGAESLLNDCVVNSDSPPRYVQDGELQLARIYLAQTNQYLDQNVCRRDYFQERLNRALNIAQKYQEVNLEDLVQAKMDDASRLCNMPMDLETPSPDIYEVEILRSQITGNRAVLDVQVIKNHLEKVSNLGEVNFQLTRNNNPVQIENFSARNTDDPVCLIAVVDNSGSINSVNKQGVDRIRNALNALNQLAKPNDEIGLVIFGELNHVRTVRAPAPGKLSEAEINFVDASDGFTALWAGVEEGIRAAHQCVSPNRYVIVITDGGNNVSFQFSDDNDAARYLSDQARSNNINVCTIGIKSKDLNEVPLVYLAQAGCDYFPAQALDTPGGEDNLASMFRTIIGFVREFYRIEFPASEILEGQPLFLEILIDGQFAAQVPVTFEK